MGMIWTYVWLLTFFLFLVLPFCFTKERRDLWTRRYKERRWNVPLETESSPGGNDGSLRFAMSKAQEEDIRKSFILESLRKYSKDVTASDVSTVDIPRLPTETSVLTTANMDIESALPTNGMDGGKKKGSEKSEGTDECSTDDVAVDDDPMDEFMGDSETNITIPIAGAEYHGEVCGNDREVPNGCAICLCAFDEADKITWSSNASCNHVFHHDCIVDWFMASGRKALQRQRRQEARTGVVQLSDDALKRITSCPMNCPCCRQEFVTPPRDDDNSDADLEKSNNLTVTETTSGSRSESPTVSETTSGNSSESIPAGIVTGDDAV